VSYLVSFPVHQLITYLSAQCVTFHYSREFKTLITEYNYKWLCDTSDPRSLSYNIPIILPAYNIVVLDSGKFVDPTIDLNGWLQGQVCETGCKFQPKLRRDLARSRSILQSAKREMTTIL